MRALAAAAVILCLAPAPAYAQLGAREVSPQLLAYGRNLAKATGGRTLMYLELDDPVPGGISAFRSIVLYRPAGSATLRQFPSDAPDVTALASLLGGEAVGTSGGNWRRIALVVEGQTVSVHRYPAGDPAQEARMKRLREEADRVFPGVPIEF